MKISVERMKPEDLEEVMEIEQVSFSSPWSKSAFEMEVNGMNRYAYYLVARAGKEIVGYIGSWFIFDEVHITNIAVKPAVRRCGIGEFLINQIFAEARARGFKGVTLEVRVSNISAQNLYTKLGFKVVGVRPGYYQDNNEDALIMWKMLDEQEE